MHARWQGGMNGKFTRDSHTYVRMYAHAITGTAAVKGDPVEPSGLMDNILTVV